MRWPHEATAIEHTHTRTHTFPRNLAGLRGKLPESIQLPASVTVPFGSFEQVGVRAAAAGVAAWVAGLLWSCMDLELCPP